MTSLKGPSNDLHFIKGSTKGIILKEIKESFAGNKLKLQQGLKPWTIGKKAIHIGNIFHSLVPKANAVDPYVL